MSKYHAIKTSVNGIVFASKAEARRYQELLLLERSGEIGSLRCQVPFPINVCSQNICKYIADFVYYDKKEKMTVVEDVKGCRKGSAYAMFKLKAKLLKAIYDIDVLETK